MRNAIYYSMWLLAKIVWTPIEFTFDHIADFLDGYGEYAVKRNRER